jgi:hypothetical protein
MQAGATITAQYKYVGGMEGVSHYGWYLHEVSLRWETLFFSLCFVISKIRFGHYRDFSQSGHA